MKENDIRKRFNGVIGGIVNLMIDVSKAGVSDRNGTETKSRFSGRYRFRDGVKGEVSFARGVETCVARLYLCGGFSKDLPEGKGMLGSGVVFEVEVGWETLKEGRDYQAVVFAGTFLSKGRPVTLRTVPVSDAETPREETVFYRGGDVPKGTSLDDDDRLMLEDADRVMDYIIGKVRESTQGELDDMVDDMLSEAFEIR